MKTELHYAFLQTEIERLERIKESKILLYDFELRAVDKDLKLSNEAQKLFMEQNSAALRVQSQIERAIANLKLILQDR